MSRTDDADDYIFQNKTERLSVTCGVCGETYGNSMELRGAKYEQLLHNRTRHPERKKF